MLVIVSHQYTRLGVGVEQSVGGGAEEPTVGIKPCLQQLVKELPEDAAPVNPSLVQTCRIHQLHSHLQFQVWL